jgi:hypothetical protein
MATEQQKRGLLIREIRQEIQMAYFFRLADRMGFMSKQDRQIDFLDVLQIELVADKLSYSGFWQDQQAKLYHNN